MNNFIIYPGFMEAIEEAIELIDGHVRLTLVQPTKEHGIDYHYINRPYLFKLEVFKDEEDFGPNDFALTVTEYAADQEQLADMLMRRVTISTDVTMRDLMRNGELFDENDPRFDECEYVSSITYFKHYLTLLDRKRRMEEPVAVDFSLENAPF